MKSNTTNLATRLQLVQYWLNWLAAGFASGEWNSHYLGRGFDFQSIAPFTEDPDLIRLNWQASLTSDELQVSQFSEERNISLYVLGNMSASMAFGTQTSKLERLATIAAIFSFTAIRLKDHFRYFGYTNQLENFHQGKNKQYPLLLAQAILDFDCLTQKHSDLRQSSLQIPSQRSLVIIVSDFFEDFEQIEQSLSLLAHKHEIIPLIIWDEKEVTLPKKFGFYPFRDLKTNQLSYLLLTPKNRRLFEENSRRYRLTLENLFLQFDIQPHFLIGNPNEDDIKALMKIFFIRRNQIP